MNTNEKLEKLYREFFDKGCIHYFGQLRDLVMKIVRMLQEEIKDKNVQYLWNNLVRAGGGKGFPYKLYGDVLKNDLNKTVPAEIEILKPDFIMDLFDNPVSCLTIFAISRQKHKKLKVFCLFGCEITVY